MLYFLIAAGSGVITALVVCAMARFAEWVFNKTHAILDYRLVGMVALTTFAGMLVASIILVTAGAIFGAEDLFVVVLYRMASCLVFCVGTLALLVFLQGFFRRVTS